MINAIFFWLAVLFIVQPTQTDSSKKSELDSIKNSVIYSDLHANIQEKFNEGGIEIMSPHYHAMRDGNSTTIPENYLPGDYKAPSFRVTKDDEGKSK